MMQARSVANDKWAGGRLLAFSGLDGQTDFENGLVCRTTFSGYGIELKSPGTGHIHLNPRPDRETPSLENCRSGSDYLELTWQNEPATTVVFADAHNILIDGASVIRLEGDSLRQYHAGNRCLISISGFENLGYLEADLTGMLNERKAWPNQHDFIKTVPPGPLLRTVDKAICQMKGMIYSPEGRIAHRWSTPDRWPHRKMWLWDSVFHAIGFRHLDVGLAKDLISSVFDCREPDGFIPHMMTPSSSSKTTQPPVLGLGISLVFEKDPDIEWLAGLYRPLAAYLAWLTENRDTDRDGLLEWFIEENEDCRSGESGMDNSTRFDRALLMGAVDFNSFLSLEYRLMARFAGLLGKEAEAGEWTAKHEKQNSLINRWCWNEEAGYYFDYIQSEEQQSPVEAVSGFLPLICGAADKTRADRLLGALKDPGHFGSACPVPSISVADPDFDGDMWRGPTWINMNWLIIRGLEESGLPEPACELRDKTLTLVAETADTYGTFFEYYDSLGRVDPPLLKRKGRHAPGLSAYNQVFFDYGWTACLFLDMVLEPCRTQASDMEAT